MPIPGSGRESSRRCRRAALAMTGQSKGALLFSLVLLILLTGCQKQKPTFTLGGGPRGGTFQNIAEGIAELANRELSGIHIEVRGSGGSVANLLAVNAGDRDMALVFAGDAYLGRAGLLKKDLPPVTDVLALARLYGAASQLVVADDSPVQTPFDLKGRRIAIGSPGSGAANSAQRFFRILGIWDQVIPIHVGYAQGMEEMRMGEVEAIWFEVGYPSAYLEEASRKMPLRMLDLFDAAVVSGFFSTYPFYSMARIPAGTYLGQTRDILTIQDAALLVATRQLDQEFAYRLLALIFGKNGLARLRAILPAAWDLDPEKGLMGVKIPLHPGAKRFWEEKGFAPKAAVLK